MEECIVFFPDSVYSFRVPKGVCGKHWLYIIFICGIFQYSVETEAAHTYK